MQVWRTSLLAGVAAALAGISGGASAQTPQTHVMTVGLPGGGVAEIRYVGDVPPRVTIGDAPADFAAGTAAASWFGPASPFALMQRISAEMDRQVAAMFRQAEAMAAQARSGQLTEAALHNLPPGSREYTFTSTISGNGVCAQSVEITSTGNGPPRVVSHSSGNCGTSGNRSGVVNLPAAAPPPAKQPDLLLTEASGSSPVSGMARRAAATR